MPPGFGVALPPKGSIVGAIRIGAVSAAHPSGVAAAAAPLHDGGWGAGGWAHGPRVHRIEEVVTLPRPIQGVNGKLKLWPVCREATAGIECAERVCAAIRASQAAKFSRSFAGRK